MTFEEYQQYFESILNKTEPPAPYNDDDYLSYAKLNWSRSKRWLKTGILSEQFSTIVKGIRQTQKWIVITEPWCGDAAHSVPFIVMAAALNPLIKLDIELRDQAPYRIDQYLTNGGKSIPKLIIKNEGDLDIATWGPRPEDCQQLYYKLQAEAADFETAKIALQEWYNKNNGMDIQRELGLILQSL